MNRPSPHSPHLNRTCIGSVLFLDIVGYTRQGVLEQQSMKEVFIDLLIGALHQVNAGERMMVDTGDGAAIAFLGDPEDALFTALSLRDAVDEGKADGLGEPGFVRMGINLGPLKMVRDVNGHLNMIGDGVNDAQRVMSFAEPGQVMVSHAYFDIVSRLSSDYSKLFVYEGTRHDKHVREHEVYRVGGDDSHNAVTDKMRDRSRARSGGDVPIGMPGFTARKPAAPLRTRFSQKHLGLAAGACAVLAGAVTWLASGTGVREPDRISPASAAAVLAAVVAAPASASASASALAPAPARTEPAAEKAEPAAQPRPDAPPAEKEKRAAPPPAPGTVTLSIQPWGEIYVDGAPRGVTPPTRTLTLPPGKHQITIRNGSFAPYSESVVVQSGTDTKLSYAF